MCADHSSRSPCILPVHKRAEVVNRILKKRLKNLLPVIMRETGFDMWLILCQEDNLDPVFATMIPVDTWCPILQMLVLYDNGSEVEYINISGTNTHELYDRPYRGQLPEKQWPLLRKIIEERDPRRIGINTGSIQWAAGGLTHNLYSQLVENISAEFVDRLESAEPLATRWLATLIDDELKLYEHVVNVTHNILAECYSRRAIVPGVTTIKDLEWYYWQRCADLGLQVSFKPSFYLIRRQACRDVYGDDDRVIRQGDFIRSDVGINYMRLNTDHQQWVYILKPGEEDAPEGMKKLMSEANRLQDIFMSEFRRDVTGNELLSNILNRARDEGVPNPKVYSHSLGHFLHEPGPLIGLPWEQERCEGRGDVKMEHNYAFAMELSVTNNVPEWDDQQVRLSMEEDVVFTSDGCYPVDGRQTEFYLV